MGQKQIEILIKMQLKYNIVLTKLLFIVRGQPMDARPNGHQAHRRTPSSSTDSPRQAAGNHGDDRSCSPPQRQAAAISSIASLALDTIFQAARSNILDQPNERKARLCEAVPCESETMELGLRHEELERLLDFLYTGSLPWEKMEKHIHTLFSLAYSYEILYRWEFCARHILFSLTPSNALQVFELAFRCRHRGLSEAALNCIFENMEEIVFSSEYQQFALRCRKMCMNMTRAFCKYAKFRGVTGV